MQSLGRYQLRGLIAAGGMAKVYLAQVVGEGGFERDVAVKVMHDHLLHDRDFVAMFLDEARVAARIRHPNVVPTLDVQKTPSAMFLVMEFIEGLSLSNLLRQLRQRGQAGGGRSLDSDDDRSGKSQLLAPLPIDMALRITIDLLGGLHAAHELTRRGGGPLHLVHRDVSPANVLVGADGVSRITDFGVAQAEARLASTQGKALKGKVPYMSPEQIGAAPVDRRSDVYSAATVLWEMLTGRRLFHGSNEGAVLHQVTCGADTPPSQLNPDVPRAIDVVCMRALSVEPQQRFGSAAAFADALEEVADVAGVTIATIRRAASFVRQFETNLARLQTTESMMNVQLGAPAPALLGAGAAVASAGAPVADSAQRISVPSVGGTPPGAVLESSTVSRVEALSPGRWAAAVAAGIVALLGGALL
ncbi:MAG: serine/threonine protein kinase, partial [Deltaproteobacteria bacterium]|nr:serine/threonine protein kinase [Deltaproteobacteria bacterium]MBW2537543.1 serine/threonine protein kinase [Deltaproteobacteria bacterium]